MPFTRIAVLCLFISAFSVLTAELSAQDIKWGELKRKDRHRLKVENRENQHRDRERSEKEEHDEYDGPDKAAMLEFEKTKDLVTGTVPRERLINAISRTRQSRARSFIFNTYFSRSAGSTMKWVERGPYVDAVGSDNPNTRANGARTAGRIRCIMVDSSDATHKTVWVGGVDGGIWKTTDITSSSPVWQVADDYLSNLAVTDICQDPSVPSGDVMYFCTGEAYYNADAVKGLGVFKSTDHGKTWVNLSSTLSYGYCTRILCDNQGNIYLATRGNGLLRSTDGGSSWQDITPTGLGTRVCDLEISSTSGPARLHVVMGIFSTQYYRYADNPASVTTTGWTAPVTAFPTYTQRAEIACRGNLLYACPVNSSYQVPTIYRSSDGGANWYATAGQPTSGWASGQGWYAVSITINPLDTSQVMVGGLDCYKTTNRGSSWTKISNWYGTTGQYVHADVHDIVWVDGGTKLIIASDGGIFYSGDGGTTIRDRNAGLRLKQFYSCAIHPTSPNYFLAGAQDNGVHQLNQPGLSNSQEVNGGDGCFVAIDFNQPQYQFGSYIYNTYSRSTDGGISWEYFDFYKGSSSVPADFGSFVNPFEYDDSANIFYATADYDEYFRWSNPQTAAAGTYYSESFPAGMKIVSGISLFNNGRVTAIRPSPHTLNRVFFGAGGRIIRIDRADTVTSTAGAAAVNITGGSMGGNVSCINTGTSDQNLMVCYSNYGATNVWVSSNGGASWTACDGNLPDMPVRWCMFYPGNDSRAIIATETGIWETSQLNGGSTVWVSNPTFPSVRTDMIRYSKLSRTFVAATHGRGLFSSVICETAPASPAATGITVCTSTAVVSEISAATGSGETVDWYDAAVGGRLLLSGNNSYTTPPLSSTTTYYAEARDINTGCVSAERSPVTVTVHLISGAMPGFSLTADPQVVCTGSSSLISAASSLSTFQYSYNGSNLSGNQLTVFPQATTDYIITATDTATGSEYYQCQIKDTITISTISSPSLPVISPASDSICNGQIQLFSASAADNNTFAFGTGTNVNAVSTSSTGYPAPYNLYYGAQRMQILIRASELTAGGYTAGSRFTSLQFPVSSLGSYWGSSVTALQNFQVKIGHTALTTLSSFQSGLTSVVPAGNFTPQTGFGNQHSFSTPFTWNGTSNIIIETTFSNNLTGVLGMEVIQYHSAAGFTNCIVYRADNVSAATAAAATTVNFSYSSRPDFRLNGTVTNPVTWSPVGGLFTNASATIPYTGTPASVIYAKPSAAGSYSYVATSTKSNGCTSGDTAWLVSESAINPPSGTDASRCGSGSVTLTATAGAGETVDWYAAASGGTIESGGTGTNDFATPVLNASTPFYAETRNPVTGCISSVRTPVTAFINPLPAKPTISSDTNPWFCPGGSVNLTSSPASHYSWNTGDTTESIHVTMPGSYAVTITETPCSNTSDSFDVLAAYCNPVLNAKLFIQGYYRSPGEMVPALANSGIGTDADVSDTVIVELHDEWVPDNPVASDTGLLHTDGTIQAVFEGMLKEGNYYVAVRQRNSMETWSSIPVAAAAVMNYDFTNAISKAYGNNQADMGSGHFAIFSGDMNQDGVIESADYSLMENDILSILFGYFVSDLTGDGIVETEDYSLMENNILKIIFIARP